MNQPTQSLPTDSEVYRDIVVVRHTTSDQGIIC
jgi:hypothetical protein